MDHAKTLVTSDLMEVGVSDIVLLAIGGETTITVSRGVVSVGLADTVAPVLNHALLLVLDHNVEEEGRVEMVKHENPDDTDTVLSVERLNLPVHVAKGVLNEAGDVLESTHLLGFVTGLLHALDKLGEVTVGLLGKGSADHVGALVDVGDTVEEALNTGEALAEMTLGVLTIVQVLSHLFIIII